MSCFNYSNCSNNVELDNNNGLTPYPIFCDDCGGDGFYHHPKYSTIHSVPHPIEGTCTYTRTHRNFTNQWWFNCDTCFKSDNDGCCYHCAKFCLDNNHSITVRYSPFYCDKGPDNYFYQDLVCGLGRVTSWKHGEWDDNPLIDRKILLTDNTEYFYHIKGMITSSKLIKGATVVNLSSKLDLTNASEETIELASKCGFEMVSVVVV